MKVEGTSSNSAMRRSISARDAPSPPPLTCRAAHVKQPGLGTCKAVSVHVRKSGLNSTHVRQSGPDFAAPTSTCPANSRRIESMIRSHSNFVLTERRVDLASDVLEDVLVAAAECRVRELVRSSVLRTLICRGYRGTSLMTINPSLAPYSRLMPRALWWFVGKGVGGRTSEVPLYSPIKTRTSLGSYGRASRRTILVTVCVLTRE